MAKTSVYNSSGKVLSEIILPSEIFDIKPNIDLVHQAIRVQLANARNSIAHTKTRGEIAGSGRKPWRQKGTGRARAGDIRMPNWVGGGVAFGPRNERNYTLKLAQKARRKALFMALSAKIKDKKAIILDKISLDKIKTSQAEGLLQALPINKGTILIIISKSDQNIELSFQNLSYVKVLNANSLNIYDILKYEWLITDKDAVNKMAEIFLGKKAVIAATPKSKSKPKRKIVAKKATK